MSYPASLRVSGFTRSPPAVCGITRNASFVTASEQGLTLVHFTAQHKRFLWASCVHFPAGREHSLWAVLGDLNDKNVSG
jgi:hypothetical protein